MDAPSRLDLYQVGRDYFVQRARRIDPNVVDTEGSDANLFAGSVSVVAKTVVDQAIYETRRLFYDGCETDDDVDRLVLDRHPDLPRKGAAPSVGRVRFFRSMNAGGAGTVPIGTRLRSLDGVDFITTSVAKFTAAGLESFADVRSTDAGSSQKAGRNAIRAFQNVQLLFDVTIQVTNDDPTAAGEDAEDSDAYVARARLASVAAVKGILAAIELGALSVPGVASAMALDVTSPDGSAARYVALYIADSSGVSNAQLAAQVRSALDEYRGGGVQVVIYNSTPQIEPISLSLAFADNVDTVALTQAVVAAVVDFVNSLGVNQVLRRSDLFALLRRYVQYGLVVGADAIVAPTGDVVPESGATIRTRLENVTVNEA